MEQCPNCGSSVNSGAKFCTICGFRLTNGERAVQKSDPIAPGEADAPVDAMIDVATLDPGGSSHVLAEPTAIATWPSSQSPVSDIAVSSESAVTQVTAEPTETETDAPSFPDWPVSTWGAPPAEPAERPESVDPSEPVEAAVASPLGALAPATGAPVTEPTPGDETAMADAPPTDAPDSGDREPTPDDQFAWWAAPPTDAPAGADEPSWFTPEQATDPQAAPSRAAFARTDTRVAETDHDPSLDRANDLLDELRGIMTSLAARPTGASSTIDIAAAVSELTTARDEASGSVDRFADLRSALAEVRSRPREIDSVLALAGHAATIAALQDAYDRYASAVDRALAGLQVDE